MAVGIAFLFAVVATIAKKAKMDKTAKFFAVIAFLTFVGWLASGPGYQFINWIQNPSVDVPSVDINQ